MDRAEQQDAGRVACTLYLARARARRAADVAGPKLLSVTFRYYECYVILRSSIFE